MQAILSKMRGRYEDYKEGRASTQLVNGAAQERRRKAAHGPGTFLPLRNLAIAASHTRRLSQLDQRRSLTRRGPTRKASRLSMRPRSASAGSVLDLLHQPQHLQHFNQQPKRLPRSNRSLKHMSRPSSGQRIDQTSRPRNGSDPSSRLSLEESPALLPPSPPPLPVRPRRRHLLPRLPDPALHDPCKAFEHRLSHLRLPFRPFRSRHTLDRSPHCHTEIEWIRMVQR